MTSEVIDGSGRWPYRGHHGRHRRSVPRHRVSCSQCRYGNPLEIRRVLRYRVLDGRFVECWLYEENQGLIDRAWS